MALLKKWIPVDKLEGPAMSMVNNDYGQYLIQILKEALKSWKQFHLLSQV